MSLGPIPTPSIADIPGAVVNGALTVAGVASDAAGLAVDAVQAAGTGVSVAGDVVGLVPGGFKTVGALGFLVLLYLTLRVLFPGVKAAGSEVAAVFIDSRAPGAGDTVRRATRSKDSSSRRAVVAREYAGSRARATSWGSGTQSHVAAPGKAPIIAREDDRQGHPRRITVCASNQGEADRRIRKAFVAGFASTGSVACDEHDGRIHVTYAPRQTAPAQRRRTSKKGSK